MQNYHITEDLEAGMGGVYQATVQSGKPSRLSWAWKIVGAIFLIALCSVASVGIAWYFMNHIQGERISALGRAAELQSSSEQGPVHPQHMLAQTANNTKAAIHLHVSGDDDSSLRWVNDVDQSFEIGGLKLENNEIVIPSDGLYFVYGQASYEVHCDSSEGGQELSYEISWFSNAAPSADRKYLLNGVKSVCQASVKKDEAVFEVIYLGAVFRLYKGDKLSAETNYRTYIDAQSSKTFFGVFQLAHAS
ncbi:tumor necrosis factor-like [Astyanax mexicanus]|uniref:Lymphotoxin-alpha n=1 Tax=Astyanax mexicanus TaxID=7994 RepID=A0A8B9HLK1_ASTMX|nr:tumor necrosis factor-like [Astyanax mexicanus]